MGRFIVYQWENAANGKRYIGYTNKTLEARFKEHSKKARLNPKCHFHKAIRKWGSESFFGEVLFVENSRRAAQETEILLILDRQPEYNKTLGGDAGPVMAGEEHPMFGVSRPDVSFRNKQRVWSEEERRMAAEKQTGKKASSETKKKMSLTRTGKSRGPYKVTSQGVAESNKRRKGTLAAALAAKVASDARWTKHRAAKAALAISEGSLSG